MAKQESITAGGQRARKMDKIADEIIAPRMLTIVDRLAQRTAPDRFVAVFGKKLKRRPDARLVMRSGRREAEAGEFAIDDDRRAGANRVFDRVVIAEISNCAGKS